MKFYTLPKQMHVYAAVLLSGLLSYSLAHAQGSGAVPTVSITVKDDVRYISGYGIPQHAATNYQNLGIQPQATAFKVDASPQKAQVPTPVRSVDFFGVSLDGVSIKHAVSSYWDGNKDWGILKKPLDKNGGAVTDVGYVYGGVPTGLISKKLTHVGYAADGFPIFVSKDNSFETSYRLSVSERANPPYGPGGVPDGSYLNDYTYVRKAGLLDECGGITVKEKYYIYVLTQDAPHLPLCWSGKPDSTFLAKAKILTDGGSDDDGSALRGLSNHERRIRERR